jgi:hypothetical protein
MSIPHEPLLTQQWTAFVFEWFHQAANGPRCRRDCRIQEMRPWRIAMLSYVYLGTRDLGRATLFYDAILGAIGLRRCVTGDPPGLRPHYGADFYAAYILDLDGNKLAAVCCGTDGA